MKYVLITLMLLLALASLSCSSVRVSSEEGKDEALMPVTIEASGAISAIPATYSLSDRGAVGFEPGKYTIENLSEGKEADLPIILHSNRDAPITFHISYRKPSYTKEGYAFAPDEVSDWLSFSNPTPILQAQEKMEVVATIRLPNKVTLPEKWEFWIAIKESGQISQVQIEGCLRVFVNMYK